MPGIVMARRGVAASIASLEERKPDLLEYIVDQISPVLDTPNSGNQRIWFSEPIRKASNPMARGNVPLKVGMAYMEGEPEPVKLALAPEYHHGPKLVPRPRKTWMESRHSIAEAAEHILHVVSQEF